MKIIECRAVTEFFQHKPEGAGRELCKKITLSSDDESVMLSIVATGESQMRPGERFQISLKSVVEEKK